MAKPTPLPPADNTPEATAAITAFTGWYEGHTRHAYETDMDMLSRWCAREGLQILELNRVQLEQYVRYLIDERHNKITTVQRRMGGAAKFYTLATADGVIPAVPTTHVRIPRPYRSDEPKAALDRYELAGFIGLSKRVPSEHALVLLMGVMGLRVGEAIALDVPDYQHVQDGHRVLKFVGKGQKAATAPIPVPVLRAIDQAVNGRLDGPLLVRPRSGDRYPYRSAYRVIKRLTRELGIDKNITPHALRRSFVGAGLDAGISEYDMQIAGRWGDSRMVKRYDHRRHSLDKHANYAIATYVAGGITGR